MTDRKSYCNITKQCEAGPNEMQNCKYFTASHSGGDLCIWYGIFEGKCASVKATEGAKG